MPKKKKKKKQKITNLESLISESLKPYPIDNYDCDNCGEGRRVKHITNIDSCPDYLVLYLQRFSNDQRTFNKKSISFPV